MAVTNRNVGQSYYRTEQQQRPQHYSNIIIIDSNNNNNDKDNNNNHNINKNNTNSTNNSIIINNTNNTSTSMFTPLKCYPAVTKTSLFLHALGSAIFGYGIYHDRTQFIDYPNFQSFGGRFKYLTMINVYFTCGASVFAFLVDILQSVLNWCDPEKAAKKRWNTKSKTSPCIRLRDELMSSWVFMAGTLVSVLFWGIAAVDLEGIHTPEHEKVSPLFGWYNNLLHTFPLVYSILLVTRVNYRYKPIVSTITQTSVAVTLYFVWLAYCAKMNGIWAYGFLRKLQPKEFAVFVVFSNVAAIFVQLVGRFLASCVWNKLVDLTEIERKRH